MPHFWLLHLKLIVPFTLGANTLLISSVVASRNSLQTIFLLHEKYHLIDHIFL